MDADEMLARALQAEEVAAAQQQGGEPQKAALLAIIQDGLRKALSVEDPAAIAHVRSVVPFEALRHEAQATADLDAQLAEQQQPGSTIGIDDLLVQELLRFFKHDFFSWVDQPPCEVCGGPTTPMGMATPSPVEMADGAGRVEVYRCSVCQQVTRFPRYADPMKLLHTRRGRCGEWAHAFLLVLRAADLDARHVTDDADHVWCEYYSSSLGRWVHVDACEESWDTPLLYEGGWGKTLSYVFAASRHGVVDVTRRYVLQPQLLNNRRSQMPGAWLTATLTRLSSPLRSGLDANMRRELGLRDAAEALHLMSLEDGAATTTSIANLPGRQSGTEAWRNARGEAGSLGARPRAAQPATPYRHAPNGDMPSLFAVSGRLTGGVCRASGENRGGRPSQQVVRLFDGSLCSKWLDFGGGAVGGTAWVEYRLLPSQDPRVVTHYDITSAEDCPERDPCEWIVECLPIEEGSSSSSGSAAGGGWVVLDSQQQQHFHRRNQMHSYIVPVAMRVPSKRWRLRVIRTVNPHAANSVQIACWNLYQGTTLQLPREGQLITVDPKLGHNMLYVGQQQLCKLQELFTACVLVKQELGAERLPVGFNTVLRIMSNMTDHPNTRKYWQLSTATGKLQLVLQSPLLLCMLLEVGFRPVLCNPTNILSDAQQLRLVADEACAFHVMVLAALKGERMHI